MVSSFQAFENANYVIYQSESYVMAAAVCDQIERAGIPAVLGYEHGIPAVVVNSEHASESFRLLNANDVHGEAYLYIN